MKPLPTIAAIGLSPRIKSKREYIQLGVQDVAGRAKPAVLLSFESCDIRAERHTSLMSNYRPMHESVGEEVMRRLIEQGIIDEERWVLIAP